MKITILSLDSLGDLVLRQPLVSALIDQGHELTVVIQKQNHVLIPYWEPRVSLICTSIYPYAPPNQMTSRQMASLLKKIKESRPDRLIVAPFHRTFLDNWLLSQLTNVVSYGFKVENDDSSNLLSTVCSIEKTSHEGQKNNLLFEQITGKSIKDTPPKLSISQKQLDMAYSFLLAQKLSPLEYVIAAPMGINNTYLKRWPEESFIESVVHLKQTHGLDVLLTGNKSEHSFLHSFSDAIGLRGAQTRIFSGDTHQFGLFLALLKLSRLYLGTDSGPMHFAAALDKPIVALFGGGTWPRFLPLARRSASIAKKLPCYGCQWYCFLKNPVCLTGVSITKIIEGIDWILSDAPDETRLLVEDASVTDLEAMIQLSQQQVTHLEVTHNEACQILSDACDERLVLIGKQQEEIQRLMMLSKGL